MSEDFTVEITGLSELQANLEKLGTDEARAIVKEGLQAGGKDLQKAMVEGATSVKGEPGELLRSTSSWSRRVSMTRGDDLAGVVRVGPKGHLSKTHTAKGGGMQPKGNVYKRSLAYIVKLLELGGRDPAYNLGRSFPMTGGFESHKDELLDRIISVIRERLKL